jgi:flagellar biogenesis protein FliO
MIEPHTPGSSDTLYEIGRIALAFGLIGIGIWIVIKLMLRSGKRGLSNKHLGINRQQRRAERAKMERKRR